MGRRLGFEDFKQMFVPQIMFEVAIKRSPTLKQIDELFRELKANPRDRKIWRQLQKRIKEFTGVKKVYLSVDNSFDNVFVFPVYNDNLPGLFDEVEKSPNTVNAEESAKYIKEIIIMYGEKMVERCNNRELTAILLHEIGHTYQHTANLSMILYRLTAIHARKFFATTGIVMGIASLFNPGILPLLIGLFLFSRTLTFFEHADELNADEYAAKYGYAEEIATAFHKFEREINQGRSSRSDGWIKKVWDFIVEFIFPDSHPPAPKRICNMIEKMKQNYNKKYPKLKKKFRVMYADLKC